MKHSHKNTAFYIEILALLFVLIFGMTVVVQVLGSAKKMSLDAKELAGAVPMAQNAAELFLAQEPGEAFVSYYDQNWEECSEQERTYSIQLDFTDSNKNRGMIRDITVTVSSREKVIYELKTKKYLPGN